MNKASSLGITSLLATSLCMMSCSSGIKDPSSQTGATITTNTASIAGSILLVNNSLQRKMVSATDSDSVVVNAVVYLLQGVDTLRHDTTDVHGNYQFDSLAVGNYSVVAKDHYGHFGIQHGIDLSKGFHLDLTVQISSNPDTSAAAALGILTDSRNAKAYKTAVIGTHVWMAENLNYDTLDGVGSWCYGKTASNCDTYGRLYTWAAALRLASSCNTSNCASQVSAEPQGVCPTSWHVSTESDWEDMEGYLGMSASDLTSVGYRGIDQGTQLQANSSLWLTSVLGSNTVGFSALPGGAYLPSQGFLYMGADANFWTASENQADSAWHRYLSRGEGTVYRSGYPKASGFSVRCVRDSSVTAISQSSSSATLLVSSSQSSSSAQVLDSAFSSSSSQPVSASFSSSSVAAFSSSSTYGTLLDTRDGQTYQTTVIGTQTWMAQNLNYDTLDGIGSWCYSNTTANCATYGRMYAWSTTLKLPASCDTTSCTIADSTTHQGLCPTGWHVSTESDWETLEAYIGMSATDLASIGYRGTNQGTQLQADTSLWLTTSLGTNTVGFSALPGGAYTLAQGFVYQGADADFWTASENQADSSWHRYLSRGLATDYRSGYPKTSGFSVRCVENAL